VLVCTGQVLVDTGACGCLWLPDTWVWGTIELAAYLTEILWAYLTEILWALRLGLAHLHLLHQHPLAQLLQAELGVAAP
jgi:hypothetical protein